MVMLSSPMLKSQSFSLPRTDYSSPSNLNPNLSARASFLDRALSHSSQSSSSSSPSLRRPHLSRRRGTSRYDPKPYLLSFTERGADLARTRLFRLVCLPGAAVLAVVWWLSSGGGGGEGGRVGVGRRAYARGDFGCEQKGLVSGNLTDGGRFDRQRVTIRIEPSTHATWNEPIEADKVHQAQFHPALSAQLAKDTVLFFNDSKHSGKLHLHLLSWATHPNRRPPPPSQAS